MDHRTEDREHILRKPLFCTVNTARAALFAMFAAVLAPWSGANAQNSYPSKPVRIVVNSAPGGGTDILARVIAQQLSRDGQNFFVENKGGAAGQIGLEAVANAPADGYTLILTPSTLTVNPAVHKKVRYDAVKDFVPITQVAGLSNVLVVHPDVPARTLAELIALAKGKPGQLNYASAGAASSPHMCMELLKHMAGIDLLHVPFKGTGPAVTEVVAGRITALFSNMLTGKPLIEGGKLRALAVSGPARVASLPDVPTVSEAVPGYSALQWYGLLAPAGTPKEIVDRLQSDVSKVLRSPDVVERLAQDGAEPVGSTSAEFAALIRSELEKWSRIAKAANIQAE
jgi:tripartite-type tricarboxylate transporter receptor subunit TctC